MDSSSYVLLFIISCNECLTQIINNGTADAEQAISWAKHSLSRAEENNYLPVDEGELQQFFDDAGKEQFASVWVYRDKNEFAKESYGICVDSFELSKSKDLLSSMFA